jgi:tetratricopeptide (TPR) repeat protein
MGYFFQRGVDDLTAAHRLEPKSIVAYRQMIEIATTQSDRASARQLIEEAMKLQPNSFLLRATYMHSLLPRWGGSYDAMARFAAESAPYASRNPRIKALAGFADWDKGRLAESEGNKGDAIEAYERALQFGNFWQFRYQRGAYNSRSDMNEDALADFNSVLSQYPQYDDALSERASIEYELGRHALGEAQASYYSQAFRDILLAASLDPANEDYQRDLAFYSRNIPEYAPQDP